MILAAAEFAALAAHAAENEPAAIVGPSTVEWTCRLDLAGDFERDGEWNAAALEYRRLAADLEFADRAGDAARDTLAALQLAAADAYRRGGEEARAKGRLLAAESFSSPCAGLPADWIRLRLDEGIRAWASAADSAETLADDAREGDPALHAWALRQAAADWVLAGAPREARRVVGDLPESERAPLLELLDRASTASEKSPTLGGLLGVIPGLGYAYSGEWGNALRSLFLNGLFGWAMYECADHDEWGLFAMTTFFEITWYTGSIYGGIDAAHRHNREAREALAEDLQGNTSPDIHHERGTSLFRLTLKF